MIALTPRTKILLAVKPADFRKGIDGLSAICRNHLNKDPFNGTLFVFTNKKRTSIKAIQYDGTGFYLHQKRLSKGSFAWWPKSVDEKVSELDMLGLQMLLFNGNPSSFKVSYFRKIKV